MTWQDLAVQGLSRFELVILAYFLFVNGYYLLLLAGAVLELRLHRRISRGEDLGRLLSSEVAPDITILAPAFNEESTVAQSVRGLLTLHYSNLELVVVSDGSTDRTMDILRQEFELEPIHTVYWKRIDTAPVVALYRSHTFPNLLVVDKENGGKADALNAALNMATSRLVCAIDADTVIEPDALQRMVRPFLERPDLVAAGGTIRPINASRVSSGRVDEVRVPGSFLPGMQVIEYLRAFLFGRMGWNRFGGNLIISGAFGLFDRGAVVATGGYAADTVGEDMELILRLRRAGYEQGGPRRVAFIPDPVAWTEVPESLRVLGRQRDRWHRGLADALWRHKRVLFNPRYGALGMVVLPHFVFVELLAPVIETLGLLGLAVALALGGVNLWFAALFFLAAYGLGMLLTIAAITLEQIGFHRHHRFRDQLKLILWGSLENFGYRQLTVLWRLRGLLNYLRGRTDWGEMERRGFSQPALASPDAATRETGRAHSL